MLGIPVKKPAVFIFVFIFPLFFFYKNTTIYSSKIQRILLHIVWSVAVAVLFFKYDMLLMQEFL